ncbi:hypothetical protein RTBOTA2_005956 [Rhodotorula toruloides]|nr:hypothetical protein RTBOTA2_005956 [Rhodotorula toruloides]
MDTLSFALVASIIQNVFGLPLLLLQRSYGAPGSVLGTVLSLLRTPFPKVAALVGLLGTVVRTGLLLEGFAADKAGDFVNAALRSSSSSSSTSSSAIDPSHLLHLERTSYPLTLSTLLSTALALPVQAPDAPPFPEHEVHAWEEASEVLRGKMERGMEEVAKGWLDVLEYLPPPSSDGEEADSLETERERRTTYLSAVRSELEAVNSRRPTRFIYLPETFFDEADLEREEERLREVERMEREKKDREFEGWVESVMGVAAAQKDGEAAAGEEAKEKRRAMLDQPMGNGGETFRQALRTQWDAMYDSSKGGVMGNVAREWDNIAAKYGDKAVDKYADGADLPEPVQIMAAQHLRSQLTATLDLLRPRDSRFDYSKKEEDEILPASMRGMAEEYMNVFQRAVVIDQRARRWADSLIDVLVPSSRLPPPAKPQHLTFKSRIHLLRSSPLPSFLRSLNELFNLPSNPAHWRPQLSKHHLANALFSLEERALQGTVGGD